MEFSGFELCVSVKDARNFSLGLTKFQPEN